MGKGKGLFDVTEIIKYSAKPIDKVKILYVNTCVNLIAAAISKVEWVTHENHEPMKKEDYFLFNVSPNQNENATEFWSKVVERLIFDNHCLIFQDLKTGYLYVADDFSIEQEGIKDILFKNVMINNLEIKGDLKRKDVVYLKLHDNNIKKVIDDYYDSFGRTLFFAMKGYERNKSTRAITRLEANVNQDENTLEKLKKFTRKITEVFSKENDEDYKVMPIAQGLEYQELENKYKSDGAKDVVELTDLLIRTIAGSFQIPIGLVKGDVVDLTQQMKMFVNLPVGKIVNLINDEFNKTYFDRDRFIKGEFVKGSTRKIFVDELFTNITEIEQAIRAGFLRADEARVLAGLHEDKLNEKELKKYILTKNYEAKGEQ